MESEGGGWTTNEPTSNGDADADANTKIDADSATKCSLRAAGREHKAIGKSYREREIPFIPSWRADCAAL